MTTSVLVLRETGVPPYSVRNARQTLAPIAASQQVRRTVNGDAIDLSASQFRKYRSTVTCTDQQPPAFGGLYPGQQIEVDCISELAYETSTGGADRTVVPGSSREEGEFTFYRPRLTMLVMSFEMSTDEYPADVSWTLELEEV